MELALAGRLAAFGFSWGLSSEPQTGRGRPWIISSVLEAYAAHLVFNGLRRLELDQNDILAVLTGGEDDAKLDAVGLLIDGKLVLSEEDLWLALETIDETSAIEFVFVQATLMDYLAQGKLEKSCTGVANFAAQSPVLAENAEVRHWRRLKDLLLLALEQRGIERKPSCSLFIVWPGDAATLRPDHFGILDLRQKDIERNGLFETVQFHLIDGPGLLALGDQEARRSETTLGFSELTAFVDEIERPGHAPVKSWQGRLVAADLVAALTDEEGRLRAEHFADNVRLYLGEPTGSINASIGQTIEGPERGYFHLINNGITFVAREIRPVGPNQLVCCDLQVINGCQTTFSLFRHREALDPSVRVLAKVVATEDRDLVDRIIVGSNRQTQVSAADLMSRLPFVRRLQLHFDALTDSEGRRVLWLERQKGEPTDWQRANGLRVVSVEDMIRAFSSIVLERPELPQIGDWKAMRALVPEQVFNPSHDPEIYEITALIIWRARELMRSTELGDHYPAKNHLMLAMRLGADPPGLGPDPFTKPGKDRQSSAYIRLMREALLSDRKSKEIALTAHRIVRAIPGALGKDFNAKAFATVDATNYVLDMAGRRRAAE